jgi:predicted CoA-binding protein
VPGRAEADVKRFLIEDDDEAIAALLRSTRRVAVLGIKTEAQAGQPAFYVPKFLVDAGLDMVPVPVYFPEVRTILGRPVYRRVADVPGPIDIVDVFRRSKDVAAHLDDLLAARPRAVWLQLGIREDRVAARLADAGILVVQDRCLMVDYERFVQP